MLVGNIATLATFNKLLQKMAEPNKSNGDGIVKPAVLHPPIIMKVDSPEGPNGNEIEDNEKNTNDHNKEDFKVCSPFRSSITSAPNPFASSQNRISKGILKPPQFNLNSSTGPSSKPFVLKPSQLNPLAKRSDNSDKINSDKSDNSDKNNQVNGETPKFVPLIVPESKIQQQTVIPNPSKHSPSPPNSVSNSTFVFGENLQERVYAGENKQEEPKASTSLGSNGTSEMLFSSAIKSDIKTDGITKEKEVKSLSESAREYEETSRANKRKYEEVEVITGEEDENNILKISCKLFSFDKVSSSWQERGRGTLRLNDFENDDHIGSRIVFRTTGSLRVILNTKIWAEMVVDKASDKSIRITALDANGEVKVFLIMSTIEDSSKLYNHLLPRLEREIFSQKHKKAHIPTKSDSKSN
nr:ran-binding protein 3 [Leptinotarsa decemlineata]